MGRRMIIEHECLIPVSRIIEVSEAPWLKVYDLGAGWPEGRFITRVETLPTTGQYVFHEGRYLFAISDIGKSVVLAYEVQEAAAA